jgi:hypothetical protein
VWQTFHGFRILADTDTVHDDSQTEVCRGAYPAARVGNESCGSCRSPISSCKICASNDGKKSRGANRC